LERDLHDGAQARLVNLGLALRLSRAKLHQPQEAEALLDEAIEELALATSELREFARGIHPAVLSEGGLGPALRALSARSRVPVRLAPLPERRLRPRVEATVYFMVAEALTNVTRYAGATRVDIDVQLRSERVTVEVRDDGRGGADPGRGSGLLGLADRVAAVDGLLEVLSPAGEGTTVRAVIPCG
jgi:signal transduction histidine kinase